MFTWVVRLFLYSNDSSLPGMLQVFKEDHGTLRMDTENQTWWISLALHPEGPSFVWLRTQGKCQMEAVQRSSSDFSALSWHNSLKPPHFTGCYWNMFTRNPELCFEPELPKWMMYFSGETVVFIYSWTGTVPPWTICLKMPSHFPLRETVLGQSLTMSFLKGYSVLKVSQASHHD